MKKVLAAAAAGAMLAALPALPANAHPGDAKARARVHCSQDAKADLKLRVRAKKGILRIDFKVDDKTASATWDYNLSRNATPLQSGSAVTNAFGEFKIRAQPADAPGPDTIGATATSQVDGETCSVTASV